jgi:hypothetical protein
MPVWLDDNTIKGELSDDEFVSQVTDKMRSRVEKEQKEKRPGNYGNDGNIKIYEETKQYKGINYKLIVSRYFAVARLNNGNFALRPGGMNKVGKHVCVETDGIEMPDGLKEFLDLSEFLYHDSLHGGQEDLTLKQQWKEMDEWAKADCKRVASLVSEFDEKVKQLKRELVEFTRSISKGDLPLSPTVSLPLSPTVRL